MRKRSGESGWWQTPRTPPEPYRTIAIGLFLIALVTLIGVLK